MCLNEVTERADPFLKKKKNISTKFSQELCGPKSPIPCLSVINSRQNLYVTSISEPHKTSTQLWDNNCRVKEN